MRSIGKMHTPDAKPLYGGKKRHALLSDEGFCLNQVSIEKLGSQKKFKVHILSPLGLNRRVVSFVTIFDRRYIADVVTGTLYSTLTGRCMTSDQRRIVSVQ